jgi:hypothetical protein
MVLNHGTPHGSSRSLVSQTPDMVLVFQILR